MIAVLLVVEEDRISQARVAVGACSAVAQRLPALEADLIGRARSEIEVRPEHLAPLAPIDDVRGAASYRMDAALEMVRRGVLAAW